MQIKIGNKYKSKINQKEFEITGINEKDKIIFYKCDGKEYHYGLIAFNHCLVNLEKVN